MEGRVPGVVLVSQPTLQACAQRSKGHQDTSWVLEVSLFLSAWAWGPGIVPQEGGADGSGLGSQSRSAFPPKQPFDVLSGPTMGLWRHKGACYGALLLGMDVGGAWEKNFTFRWLSPRHGATSTTRAVGIELRLASDTHAAHWMGVLPPYIV